MRYTPALAHEPVQELLDPHRVVRWGWTGRLAVASALLMAAIFVWREADPADTLLATVAFALAVGSTVGGYLYCANAGDRPLGTGFLVQHIAADLALVTLAVHLTGGWSSQFAALYVLVICASTLLLPIRGGIAVALAACALYAGVVVFGRPEWPGMGLLVQWAVFLLVAGGLGMLVGRIRQLQIGRSAFTEQLMTVQFEAADILRSIRSGILTVDQQGRLLYANPTASELLGVDLEARVGRPVSQVLASAAPGLVDLLEQSCRSRQKVSRAEGTIHRQGETVEIGVATTVVEAPGGQGRVTATAIFQDISDSKRLQALHVRTERLQAVAELSASLAHEIRNPLASIRSATEQLDQRRARIAAEEDEDGALLHALVVREADRLSRLLADFLDFARAQVSRLVLLDMGAVARTAAELAAAHPDRPEGIRLAVEVSPGLPPVEGDEDLLHRAVFNLVLNAVQAVPPGGHVEVRVEPHAPMDVALERGGGAVAPPLIAISVTDDGPGIPRELRTRLFEPFVSGKPGGTGLGLPVVHRAVEAHRGLVLVDSLPRGTRFTMFLPASPVRTLTPAVPSAPPVSAVA